MDFEAVFLRVNEIIHQSIKKYKDELLASNKFSKITVSQFMYIESIYNLGNPTLSDIACHLRISKASVSTAVQKLIINGFAKKTQSFEDKRIFHIQLTQKSRALINAEKKALKVFFSDFINVFSEEEKAKLLNLFNTFLEKTRK